MKVFYTCAPCGIRNAAVEVPERGDDEGAVHWVGETVARAVFTDHTLRSPYCFVEKMSELRIPVVGTDSIGKLPRN